MTEKTFEICPLCNHRGDAFHKDEFYVCRNCQGIFRSKKYLLSPALEKIRYEKHNNDVNDKGYQQFVSPITNAVLEECSINDTGLDFGSGTGSAVSKILKDNGFNIREYDPFFHNQPELLKENYDYIICCEVIEHFHNPQREFTLLKQLLRPQGTLYCMTDIYDPNVMFSSWYYKDDETHVFIYKKGTLEWIKNHFDFELMTIDQRLIRFIK
jgi:SAM-dependent methyltransferase